MSKRVVLDTNALIRFFTGDDPAKMKKVQKLLNTQEDIYIPEAVFPETEYVLSKVYHLSKQDIEKAYDYLNSNPRISFRKHIREAIALYKSTTLGMYGSLIAVESFRGLLASYDDKLLSTSEVQSYWRP